MATQKPISTISYNSREFLIEKLNSLYESHIIQCYMLISHKGEYNEELKKCDKDHHHVRIEPNKKLDPMDITDLLTEYVQGEKLPRKVRTWRQSKEEDWFLYAVHDKKYMEIKYPNDPYEKIPYDFHDIVVSEGYDLETAFIRAKQYLAHTAPNLVKQLVSGVSPIDLVSQGENAFQINTIVNLMNKGNNKQLQADYVKLQVDYSILQEEIANIKIAINDANKDLMLENGKYVLIDKVFKE